MRVLSLTTIVIGLSIGQKAPLLAPERQSLQIEKKWRKIHQKSFKPGEKLVYRLSYGLLDAGEATLSVLNTEKVVNGRSLWHLRGVGKTISVFEWFYKVYDVYESYVDVEALVPWIFKRRVNEGGFKINQDYKFHQHRNQVENEKGKVFDAPVDVQDMLSAFYYARTLAISKARKGTIYQVSIFLDDQFFTTKVKYLGEEVIRTRKGKFRCHKLTPLVEKGRIFKNGDALTAWITADENKIPVMVEAKIQIGKVKMQLVQWENLSNPMARVK